MTTDSTRALARCLAACALTSFACGDASGPRGDGGALAGEFEAFDASRGDDTPPTGVGDADSSACRCSSTAQRTSSDPIASPSAER